MSNLKYFILTIAVFISAQLWTEEHVIPITQRFVLQRETSESPIVYYFNMPKQSCASYPILILCEGSTSRGDLGSVLYIRNYFAERIEALPVGYLTIEKWGIDGSVVNETEFWQHYTRSQRLQDHLSVIQHFQDHPPEGWNGQFIFVGVSEGGLLVTDLSTHCPNTLATINWVGAGDWSWREELWCFIQQLLTENPKCPHECALKECQICLEQISSRARYDAFMDTIITNPSPDCDFLGMTYLYHADACTRPHVDYTKINHPFLVVKGTIDSDILSCDQFISKALANHCPITYFRIEGMDHWLRNRSDVIEQSFDWLKKQLLYNAGISEKI